MIVAYRLLIYDGDADFFEDRHASIFCRNCGTLLDKSYLPTGLCPRKAYDICSTFDGRTLVNERFKVWSDKRGYEGLLYHRVNERPPYYALDLSNTVRFYSERAKTRFENKCPICGNFESVVGTYPLGLLQVETPLEDGFFRTDLEFGSRWEKHPLIIVGLRVRECMKQERFRLVDFEPIHS